TGYERVLTRFGTPERGLAIYDTFGGVLAATADVRPFLGPLSPLVSDAIRSNEPVAGFQNVAGRLTWVHVVPVQQDERAAGAAAEQEARLGLAGESVWTEERLKQFVEMRFGRRPVFVVSNREPVSHVRDGRVVREQEPASGLVTALGPIMQACGGVWVAHGSGNADRDVGERIGLPSADPAYTLRRVWLSDEEEAGYYYGFANEGLWPLCHIVHERPRFRAADWGHYRAVNER